MTTQTSTPTRRAEFAEIEIGQKFFDLISAEYFIKTSDTTAAMVRSGVGDPSKADEFEPDDVVRVDE
mgnify:CR=1 FL=1